MKPVLLLIPGMFNTAAIWQPVAAQLQSHADACIADVLTQNSIKSMADDAWHLVAGLPAGTPLVVAGFSMGGYVAIELLAAHRAHVSAVALVDTSAKAETPESTVLREKAIAALQRNFSKVVDSTIAFSLHPENHANTALLDSARRMMHAVGQEAAIRQLRAIIARTDHQAMLSHLHMPTLVVCGLEDKVTPPELSQQLAALIPGARLEWIEHAGHQTPAEQPDVLAGLLLSLVQEAQALSPRDAMQAR